MIKKLTCIECPKGCALSVDIENCRVVKVSGNDCPKGQAYAISEVENPVRIFTSTVRAKGLSLKMAPVRTDKPIPKSRIQEAMSLIKKITIKKHLHIGGVVDGDFLGLGVKLIVTRSVR